MNKVTALADFVGQTLARQGLVIERIITMSGGAIQENLRLDYSCADGKTGSLVLRTDAATLVAGSHKKADEYAVLSYVHAAGIKTPRPIALCQDTEIIGKPFILMEYLPGTTDFARIRAGARREELAVELGRELAAIHRLSPVNLPFLKRLAPDPVSSLIRQYRAFFDQPGMVRPVAEWAMRWCLSQTDYCRSSVQVLVHGDFRTANYLVDQERLTGLLDWEFSGWGDPYSDLGWFCARCWRYGYEGTPAGGIASRDSFYQGYRAVSGEDVDPERVKFWEVMALLRWLVIAMQQGERNYSGGEKDLELGLTGLIRPLEIEDMLLEMTAPFSWKGKTQNNAVTRDKEITVSALVSELLSGSWAREKDILQHLMQQIDSLPLWGEAQEALVDQGTDMDNRALKKIIRIAAALNQRVFTSTSHGSSLPESFEESVKTSELITLRDQIRSGCYDREEQLYQLLLRVNRSKLEIISPASLAGYVALLGDERHNL
ncbi:phosphotransferase family protein [Kiloniella laminariae]|uniref:Phosphotransferase family protein n=1 Tax=Kiloniella laminariae TaxID=454162 RepID=A0ABT4LN98_9PROT|nr:phosphotransferase family protein [Kiloniella laminariae]MCZ4282596.1 phosphotransferase family protein [Kiloniella laminariae]